MQAPSTGSMRSFFWNLLMGCKKAIFLMMPINLTASANYNYREDRSLARIVIALQAIFSDRGRCAATCGWPLFRDFFCEISALFREKNFSRNLAKFSPFFLGLTKFQRNFSDHQSTTKISSKFCRNFGKIGVKFTPS
jgi:hypothetical protein